MKWANFLHIYQPADQQSDILEAIVAQCYRPLITHIANSKDIKITLNLTGALIELFDKHGYRDLIELLKQSGEEGKIEFTSSAKYHGFLPLLTAQDIKRQIVANDETMTRFLGKKAYKPKGFFPPEMGYDKSIIPVIEEMGFEWIILDEISGYGEPGKIDYNKIYKIKDSKLKVFFRERRLSNLIMSAVVRSKETLLEAMKDDMKSDRYIVTAMDGETFGHHRPGLEKMLFDILDTKDFNLITISDLLNTSKKEKREEVTISLVPSTWASSKQDIEKGIQFLSWKDPENIIHTWQWELFHLVRDQVENLDKKNPIYESVRNKMDIATASDHFWWASAKPWWSLEMIEDGEYRLLETLRMIPEVSEDNLRRARDLYEKIISTAFQWQRTGKIRTMMSSQNSILRIPFKDRTIGRGGAEAGVYHAFIDMMKTQEKLSSLKGEYEKAILWRDAIYKLENKLDIYDTINAIDLLRIEISNEEVEKTILKYKEKYKDIRGGQPEQRGN
jgi:alpha-amylase/alpha-mannosidase (GH57 family)